LKLGFVLFPSFHVFSPSCCRWGRKGFLFPSLTESPFSSFPPHPFFFRTGSSFIVVDISPFSSSFLQAEVKGTWSSPPLFLPFSLVLLQMIMKEETLFPSSFSFAFFFNDIAIVSFLFPYFPAFPPLRFSSSSPGIRGFPPSPLPPPGG